LEGEEVVEYERTKLSKPDQEEEVFHVTEDENVELQRIDEKKRKEKDVEKDSNKKHCCRKIRSWAIFDLLT